MYVYVQCTCNIVILCMYVHVRIGLKLGTVFDVMQLNPLPKVVCSLQAWKGDDDKSSIVENELLVLKQVCLALRKVK